jgi:hypothetical protein
MNGKGFVAMNPRRTAYFAYISAMTALGAAAIALSLYRVLNDSVSYQWIILAYLTVLTSAFTIKIPRVNSKFSASDTFIFINIILFGTAAGVLTAALDGFVGSFRCRTTARRKQTIPFNTAVLGLSVFAAGEVFFKVLGQGCLSQKPSVSILALALPLILSALVYYLCNSTFVAAMLALDGGGNAFRLWRQGLHTTLGITFAGTAAGALIAFSTRSITPLTLLIVVPILVSIYFIDMIYLSPKANADAAADANNPSVADRPAYRRFHYFMVALGLGFIVLLVQNLLSDRISYQWILIGSLAVFASFISVKIPGVNIRLSLADVFIFANTILFGPVVGGITAALDGLAGSTRFKNNGRRMEFTLFNIANMALSAYIAGELFFRILGHGPVYQDAATKLGGAFLPAMLLAISYYILNSMGVAIIVALQAHENVFRIWRENLMFGLIIYVACALGAVFVATGMAAISPMIIIAVLLLLTVVYISFRASLAVDKVPQRTQPTA